MENPLIVVLAGGIGRNFKPLVTNKTLFPFCGQPLLRHILSAIKQGGGRDVLAATTRQNDRWIRDCRIPGLKIKTVLQPAAKGMADALLHLRPHINRPMIVLSGVDLVEPQLIGAMIKKAPKAYALVAGMHLGRYFPGGYLMIKDKMVTGIVEKPDPDKRPSNYLNLVCHYFSRPADFLDLLEKEMLGQDDKYERALNKLMAAHPVGYVPYRGSWQKLKFSFHVLPMAELFLSRITKQKISDKASISPQSSIQGPVVIEDGADIQDGAVIKGPAYIGRNAVIGNHSLIRQSMIEENTVIGFGSEIARSYVGPHCALHHNFIGDSILENQVNPSYGTGTANMRLDGKEIDIKLPGLRTKRIPSGRKKMGAIVASGAFFGVNCSLMPGITVGARAVIYPNTLINKPVRAKAVVSRKFFNPRLP